MRLGGISAGAMEGARIGFVRLSDRRLTTLNIHARTPILGLVFFLPRVAEAHASQPNVSGMPMNDYIMPGVLEAVLVVVATFFATRWYLEGRAEAYARKAQAEADRILEEAETRRRDAAIEAKDEA